MINIAFDEEMMREAIAEGKKAAALGEAPIGAVIVLLIWLYMSAAVLIMGAEFNGTIMSLRKDGRGEV